MTLLFFILIVVVCALISVVVLIQNPKGGGLSGSLAGFNTQFMSVKQTTDTLEKGTWIFISALVILCLVSTLFLSGGTSGPDLKNLQELNTTTIPTTTTPANNGAVQQQTTVPMQQDSGK